MSVHNEPLATDRSRQSLQRQEINTVSSLILNNKRILTIYAEPLSNMLNCILYLLEFMFLLTLYILCVYLFYLILTINLLSLYCMYWRDRNIEVGGQTGGRSWTAYNIILYPHSAIFTGNMCDIKALINIFKKGILRDN